MMAISPRQLPQILDQNKVNVFVITGPAAGLVDYCKQTFWQYAKKDNFSDRSSMVIQQAADCDQLYHRLFSPSLFSDLSHLDCHIATTKLGKKGYEQLQQCVEMNSVNTRLCLYFPQLENTKQKWFGKMINHACHIDCQEPKARDLPQWINFFCQQQQLRLTLEQVKVLASYTEGNLSAASQEILKLSLLSKDGVITTATMTEALSHCSQHSLFELLDTTLAGNTKKMFLVLHRLKQQAMAPVLILWGIIRECRSLITIKAKLLQKQSWSTVMQQQGIWASRQGLVKQALEQHSIQTLFNLLKQAAQIEYAVKGLAPNDPWQGLERLLLDFAKPLSSQSNPITQEIKR